MGTKTVSDIFWGKNAKAIYLLLAAAVMLFTLLGGREIWTQEHRWADIVSGMFYRHDFLHPYLGENDYYDKPLLSYWLIAGFSYISGQVTTWAMRLPSALAGLLAVWSIYRLGARLQSQRLGLLAGWMLVTTFYFLFWAKTSSADMLNMAGALFAVYWYYEKREEPGFFNYAVFFMTLAITSLCKGLTGAIVPLIMIFPDLIQKGQWKKHLRFSFLFAMVPALIVYVLPFWASSYFGGAGYGENGLYLVYRENVLRYFQPFDHKGPLYTYFVFLPVYLMPWAFFFIPALFGLKTRWKTMPANLKSVCWGLLLLFIFFTVSGSRRNYYVLPLVPFAILMTADWILSGADALAKRYVWAGRTALSFLVIMFLAFDVVQPLYYAEGGMTGFATQLKTAVSETRPWSDWQFVMLDPESKTRFYLGLPPTVKNYAIQGKRDAQTAESLAEAWPVLRESTTNTIYITRKIYEPVLRQLLPNYRVVEATATLGERLLHKQNPNAPVAFVPVSAS